MKYSGSELIMSVKLFILETAERKKQKKTAGINKLNFPVETKTTKKQ
jgi:hypothetical protein